ncbi:hypothetical protein [Pseudomonas poae]|uniref:hypothetical protein n=1 Tax=Pseudomonas poae TaxID=200451 RepID=UPI003BB1AF01
MELTLHVEAHGHADVGNNVRGALETIGENAGHIKQGLAPAQKTPMRQPLFDFDLKRVSSEHYVTGKAAINFPHSGSTTGGWHYLSYFDRVSGVAKVSLAGIHYPDTTAFFSDLGIIDVTEQMAKPWLVCRRSTVTHGGSLSSRRRHDQAVGI